MKLLKIGALLILPVTAINSVSTKKSLNENIQPDLELKPVELESKSIEVIESIPVEEINPIKVEYTLNQLIDAMIQVESRGRDSVIGDKHIIGGEAVGALQIRPIMVKEVNRLLKKQKLDKRYKLSDRYSRALTIEMFMVWKNYHHSDSNFEKIARCWNGGPRGWKKQRTEYYWSKVQKELDI